MSSLTYRASQVAAQKLAAQRVNLTVADHVAISSGIDLTGTVVEGGGAFSPGEEIVLTGAYLRPALADTPAISGMRRGSLSMLPKDSAMGCDGSRNRRSHSHAWQHVTVGRSQTERRAIKDCESSGACGAGGIFRVSNPSIHDPP